MSLWSRFAAWGGLGRYYESAGSGARFKTVSAPRTGPNDPIIASGASLADRSYALERNEPFVWRGINALCAIMVGTGVQPESQVDDPQLQHAIHDLWDVSSDEMDADGVTDVYGQQALALRSIIMGGDAFGRLRDRLVSDGLAVPLQVQGLESAMVPRDKNEIAPNGNRIRAGIEKDGIGRTAAFHVFREHPHDMQFGLGLGTFNDTVRVPAEFMLHAHEQSRFGQLRGEPRLARIILAAMDFHAGEDALQQAWNIAAAMTGFITMTHPDFIPLVREGETTPDATGTVATTVKAGDFSVLRPGEEVTMAKPPEVGTTYGEATRLRLRRMAAGLGITYEALSGDLETVSYTSGRLGAVQCWMECDQFLWQTLVPGWCRPLWLAWFRKAVQADRLPIRQRDFNADPRKFTKVVWNPPKRPWVDPLKDIQAEIMAINAGLKSRDESIRTSLGRTPEQVDRERKRSSDRAKDIGVTDGPATAQQQAPTNVAADEPADAGAAKRRPSRAA